MTIYPDAEENSSSPLVHCTHIRRQLGELIEHFNADQEKVKDVRFQALLEVSAEMLHGIRSAFAQYEESLEKSAHPAK